MRQSFFLITLVFLLACDDSNQTAQCTSDDDCREGYSCDLETYIGECVQRRQVQACGQSYCIVGEERCLDQMCISIQQAGEQAGAQAGAQAGEQAGEQAGAQAGEQAGELAGAQAGELAGVQAGELAGVQAGEQAGEELIESVEWILDSQLQAETQLLEVQEELTVSGRIQTMNGGTPQGAFVRFEVRSEYSTDHIPDHLSIPIDLVLDAEGQFTQDFNFPQVGVYEISLTAYDTQGLEDEVRLQQTWMIRVDEFVQVQNTQLHLNQQSYKYFSISIPDVLPWLEALDQTERIPALNSLFDELNARSIDALRVFIGRTLGEYALRERDGSLNETRVNLLDLFLEQAGLNEIKVILVLADARQELDRLDVYLEDAGLQNPSDDEQNLLFTDAEAKASFFTWLSVVTNHQNPRTGLTLSDDPTILAWELFHLPRWDLPSPLATNALSDFLIEAFQELAEQAPNQLIFSGEIGLDYNPTAYQEHAQHINSLMLADLLNGNQGGVWSSLRMRTGMATSPQNIVSGLSLESLSLQLNTLNQQQDWLSFGQAWLRGHALANIPSQRPLVVHLSRLNRNTLGQNSINIWRQWVQECFSQGYAGITLGDFYLNQTNVQDESWSLSLISETRDATLTMLNDLSERFRRQ